MGRALERDETILADESELMVRLSFWFFLISTQRFFFHLRISSIGAGGAFWLLVFAFLLKLIETLSPSRNLHPKRTTAKAVGRSDIFARSPKSGNFQKWSAILR